MTGSDRVPYVTDRDQVPDGERHHYDSIAESRGHVRGPFSVLLNSPELAGRVGRLGAYVRYEGDLPDEDREVAILATARTVDCPYEWAAHAPIAREGAVSDSVIDGIADRAGTEAMAAPAATVVAYAREILRDHAVSDATFARARDRYGEAGVVELTATIGYYAMLACVLNAFEVLPGEGAARFA